jgi:hypothetical protein
MAKKYKYDVYSLINEFRVTCYHLNTLSEITKTDRGILANIFKNRSQVFTGIKDHKVWREEVDKAPRKKLVYIIYDSKKVTVKTCKSLREVAEYVLVSEETISKRIGGRKRIVNKLYNISLGYFMELEYA